MLKLTTQMFIFYNVNKDFQRLIWFVSIVSKQTFKKWRKIVSILIECLFTKGFYNYQLNFSQKNIFYRKQNHLFNALNPTLSIILFMT